MKEEIIALKINQVTQSNVNAQSQHDMIIQLVKKNDELQTSHVISEFKQSIKEKESTIKNLEDQICVLESKLKEQKSKFESECKVTEAELRSQLVICHKELKLVRGRGSKN